MPATPVIALVGPPNVGKSTLFNTILGVRKAVTGPQPGTTRDRAYAKTAWNGKNFILIDTGGLARKSGDPLENSIREQAEVAMTEADLVVFVVDGKAPKASSMDAAKEFKQVIRKHKLSKLPIILVANKVDSPKMVQEAEAEFGRLGIGPVFPISALTGRGVGDLLDEITRDLKDTEHETPKDIFATVAIVGRPNVGKSTLINKLMGSNRVIVSPIPGTTRASVDVDIKWRDKTFRFIDTAGMRRRAKIDLDVEEYSLFQSVKSIENADVVILLLDAAGEPARFEQTIAGKLKNRIKGIILALNKIDKLADRDELKETETATRMLFPFLKFSNIVSISALKGTKIDKLMEAVVEAKEARDTSISDEELANFLKKAKKKFPPRKLRDQRTPRIFEIVQTSSNPPTFTLIVNEVPAIHYSYVRYLENELRKDFNFEGTAIKIRVRKPRK